MSWVNFFFQECGFSQIPDVYNEKYIWDEMLMIPFFQSLSGAYSAVN